MIDRKALEEAIAQENWSAARAASELAERTSEGVGPARVYALADILDADGDVVLALALGLCPANRERSTFASFDRDSHDYKRGVRSDKPFVVSGREHAAAILYASNGEPAGLFETRAGEKLHPADLAAVALGQRVTPSQLEARARLDDMARRALP